MLIEGNGPHSREALAGYDRNTMEKAVAVLVGLGAAGSNVAQALALSGVGELRLVDPDVVEASNLTRSPFFRRERLAGGRERHKAREVALGALAVSTAAAPRVRYAAKPVEALGYAAFRGASVLVSGVDSPEARAYLADVSRELRVPLVEVGFMGHEGHVSVFRNADDGEPCWRCLNPRVAPGRLSCREYARAVVARGMVPATQPLAAAFAALAAEAAIGALHSRFELAGRHLGLDVRSGRSRLLEISPEPACPGAHRALRAEAAVAVSARQPLAALFEALRPLASEPLVHLPADYVVSAPCAACGGEVSVHRPAWALGGAPRCRRGCPPRPTLGGRGAVAVSALRPGDELAQRPCLALGLAPGTLVVVEDLARGSSFAVELEGGPDDLYVTRTREDAPDADPPADGAAPDPDEADAATERR